MSMGQKKRNEYPWRLPRRVKTLLRLMRRHVTGGWFIDEWHWSKVNAADTHFKHTHTYTCWELTQVKLLHIHTPNNFNVKLFYQNKDSGGTLFTFRVQGSGRIQVEVPVEEGDKVRGHRNPSGCMKRTLSVTYSVTDLDKTVACLTTSKLQNV